MKIQFNIDSEVQKAIIPILFFLTIISCSEASDTNDSNPDVQELIIGDWDFISENSYFCSNDEIEIERPANGVVNSFTFLEDGTYVEIEDGVLVTSGNWTKNLDGTYNIVETENLQEDTSSYDIKVEFDGKDIMRWGIYGCEDNDSDTYIYARYDRKN